MTTAGLLVLVAFITFVIFFILPQWAGQTPADLASAYVGRGTVTPSGLLAVETRLGLNEAVIPHFLGYLKAIVAGATYSDGFSTVRCPAPCLGYSFQSGAPVWQSVIGVLPITLSIAVGAAVVWLVFGIASGVVSAVYKGTVWDRASMAVSLLGVSLPVYFIGPLAMILLCYNWSILPDPVYVGITQNPGSWAADLILPWTCLALGYAALYTRLTRAGMLEALDEDFVRTARAKGLRERTVIRRHALRAAITPIVTLFGMDLGTLLGGAVLAELTFSMHGMGYLAITAIKSQDFPMIMGVTLFAAFFVILANLVVDVAYAGLDPRVRVA